MSSCTIKVERDGDLQEVNPKDLTNSELCHLLSELLIDSEFATSDECHDWALAKEEAVRRLKQNGEAQDNVGQSYDAKPVVNAAKLREALIDAKGWLIKCLDGDNCPTEDDIRHAIDGIESALAEPVRNCDVGTSDEQAERFENFCLEHIGCAEETGGRHCIGCPLEKASRHITQKCELYWAQLPYVEKGGGNDGNS